MDWKLVLAWVATTTSILCQVIGIEICFRIVRKGTTGDVSPAPFFAFFVSACLWLKYAIMQNISTVMITNSCGAVLQFLYICIFYSYTVRKSMVHKYLFISLTMLFCPLIYVRYFQLDEKAAAAELGLYCCFGTVLCYASPLASLKEVFKTKSCNSMSFSLCLLNFACAVEWFVYGAVIQDANVSLPNIVGIVLGLIQLGLFCVYPLKSSSRSSSTIHL